MFLVYSWSAAVPERGVAFHPTLELLASCGDHGVVTIFDVPSGALRRKLLGRDYVRSVQFHPTLPWLLSASDDGAARIWDWRSGACIAVLLEHTHYVMAAVFHPTLNVVATASLDRTVRIWQFDDLRMKADLGHFESLSACTLPDASYAVPVCRVLQHPFAVNCVTFHPVLPLLASGTDEAGANVRVWDLQAADGSNEFVVPAGHTKNVNAVLFNPFRYSVITCSEDCSVRVCDFPPNHPGIINEFKCPENSQAWCLALHPSGLIAAAGHDSGVALFRNDPMQSAQGFPFGQSTMLPLAASAVQPGPSPIVALDVDVPRVTIDDVALPEVLAKEDVTAHSAPPYSCGVIALKLTGQCCGGLSKVCCSAFSAFCVACGTTMARQLHWRWRMSKSSFPRPAGYFRWPFVWLALLMLLVYPVVGNAVVSQTGVPLWLVASSWFTPITMFGILARKPILDYPYFQLAVVVNCARTVWLFSSGADLLDRVFALFVTVPELLSMFAVNRVWKRYQVIYPIDDTIPKSPVMQAVERGRDVRDPFRADGTACQTV